MQEITSTIFKISPLYTSIYGFLGAEPPQKPEPRIAPAHVMKSVRILSNIHLLGCTIITFLYTERRERERERETTVVARGVWSLYRGGEKRGELGGNRREGNERGGRGRREERSYCLRTGSDSSLCSLSSFLLMKTRLQTRLQRTMARRAEQSAHPTA